MKPFDEAILAAVLVGSERLKDRGVDDVRFFTKDSDLWPWLPKHGGVRTELRDNYTYKDLELYLGATPTVRG